MFAWMQRLDWLTLSCPS